MTQHEPPHSAEAERYLLSMVFQDGDYIKEAVEIGLEASHFYVPEHATLFECAVESYVTSGDIVVEEFISDIAKNGKLDAIGGMANYVDITKELFSSRSVKYWADEIKDRADRRAIIAIASGASTQAYDLEADPHTVLAAMSNRSLDAINDQEKPVTLAAAVDTAKELVDRITAGEIIEGELGIPTPIDGINRFLGAPTAGELITIAARPGGGKSSIMRGLMRHIAENFGRALLFSREMPMDQLVTVFAQEASRVSWKSIKEGTALKEQVPKFQKGLDRVKGLGPRLMINDRDRTVDQLIARIAAASRSEKPLKAVAVDYLQRYDPQQQRGETRDMAIGRMTMALKDAAIQHNLPVFLGAQIGRGSERENRAPRLSDLRESGNIEQDSDRVWFMWIPDQTPEGAPQDPNDQQLPLIYVQLIQAKGRSDGLGKIDLAFHRRITTFTEWKDR
jgi:replicative DNA helicase